eukprot:7258978-Alexandrium_andersonii.AAC.1
MEDQNNHGHPNQEDGNDHGHPNPEDHNGHGNPNHDGVATIARAKRFNCRLVVVAAPLDLD